MRVMSRVLKKKKKKKNSHKAICGRHQQKPVYLSLQAIDDGANMDTSLSAKLYCVLKPDTYAAFRFSRVSAACTVRYYYGVTGIARTTTWPSYLANILKLSLWGGAPTPKVLPEVGKVALPSISSSSMYLYLVHCAV